MTAPAPRCASISITGASYKASQKPVKNDKNE
jgi:hypothetical protein